MNMSGVVFKITIPTQEYESAILEQNKRKPTDQKLQKASEHASLFIKNERKPLLSPRKETLKTGSCERVQQLTDESTFVRKSMLQVFN